MAKNPTERIENHRQEILDAFLSLFADHPFNQVHIKAISEVTRFTRPTIYNYFKNIDEIFLYAYQMEYTRWAEELEKILAQPGALTPVGLARAVAESLGRRTNMLRFSLENFHEREAGCRREFVFDHKAAFGRCIELMRQCFGRARPDWSEGDVVRALYIFFPFLHGMYRYVDLTPIQKEAVEATHLVLQGGTVYSLAYEALAQILQ